MTAKLQVNKRQVIIQAALELIAEQGFHATPMAQVASHAGVGVGSIYRYFKDRDDLIHAIHEEYSAKIEVALIEGYDPKATQKEQFFSLMMLLANFYINSPLQLRFADQYYNSPYGVKKKREEVIGESLTVPDTTPFPDLFSGSQLKDLPVIVLHNLTFSPLIACIRDHLSGLLPLDDELIENISEASWAAISSR